MKYAIRTLALALAIMLLSTSVLAADENDRAKLTDVDTCAVAVFDAVNAELIHVTYTSDALESGSYYLVLMVKSDAQGNYNAIHEDNILFIDQVQADESGSLRFHVSPSMLTTGTILITGLNDGICKAVIVEAKYILGDVDDSGEVDVGDVTLLLRYLAGLVDTASINLAAADVDGSGKVDVGDATKLLCILAQLEQVS